jgi:hypothetical protein
MILKADWDTQTLLHGRQAKGESRKTFEAKKKSKIN